MALRGDVEARVLWVEVCDEFCGVLLDIFTLVAKGDSNTDLGCGPRCS